MTRKKYAKNLMAYFFVHFDMINRLQNIYFLDIETKS
jgi:hypothetical protein